MKITPWTWVILFSVLLVKALSQIQEHRQVMRLQPQYDTLFLLCKSIDIQFPEVVAVQALHETGYLKSNIFLANHNMFGIKNHSTTKYCIDTDRRPDTIIVEGVPIKVDKIHCWYPDWQSSIMDYKEYQKRRLTEYQFCTGKTLNSIEEYLYMLDHMYIKKYGCDVTFRYATDKKYTDKLRKYLKKYGVLTQ